MKQEELSILDRFDTVWQRVTAGNGGAETTPAPVPARETAMLEELMDGTVRAWSRYTALARRTGGTHARQLAALAGSARDHLRKLHLEYFLDAGDTYAPGEPPRTAFGLLTELREAYRGELALAEQFAAAGRYAPSRRNLYESCAGTCLNRADRVKTLIAEGFGAAGMRN